MGIAPQPDAFTRSDYLATPAPPRGVKESYVNVGAILAPRPHWQDQAACRGVAATAGPDGAHPFFPDSTGSRSQLQSMRMQLTYCDRCPVAAECGEAGAHESWGIWGPNGNKHAQYSRRRRAAARGLEVVE